MFLVLRGCESLTFGDATPFIEQVFFEQIEAYTWNFRHFPPWFKRDGRLSCFFFGSWHLPQVLAKSIGADGPILAGLHF